MGSGHRCALVEHARTNEPARARVENTVQTNRHCCRIAIFARRTNLWTGRGSDAVDRNAYLARLRINFHPGRVRVFDEFDAGVGGCARSGRGKKLSRAALPGAKFAELLTIRPRRSYPRAARNETFIEELVSAV